MISCKGNKQDYILQATIESMLASFQSDLGKPL